MAFNREATRQRRIANIQDSAPTSLAFRGFGGSSHAYETLVYFHEWIGEVRIPVFPRLFPPEQVESEYMCTSVADWDNFQDMLEDYDCPRRR